MLDSSSMLAGCSPEEWTAVRLSLKVALWATVASLPLGVARRAGAGARPVLGQAAAERPRPPAAGHAAGGDRLPAAALLRPPGADRRSCSTRRFGIVFAFRWTGAALACGGHGLPADGARDPAVDRGGRPAARGGRRHARRQPRLDVPRRHPAADRCPASSPARSSASPRRWASSARRSPSSPTSPARPRRCPRRSTASLQVPGGERRRDPADADRDRDLDGGAGRSPSCWRGGSPGASPAIERRHGPRGRAAPPARRLPARRRLRGAGRRHRAVRPLRRRQDHGRQRHRRAAAAGRRAASSSTARCCSTPPRGVFVPRHRRRIGYVFQEGRLFPHLTVRQNLRFGRWFAPRGERAAATSTHVVELLGIGAAARPAAGRALGRREAAGGDRPGAARRARGCC